MYVRPKKHLGQHFLLDETVCQRMADALRNFPVKDVLEIGPGTGALTKYLLKIPDKDISVVEVDDESVEYLNRFYVELHGKIYSQDVLKANMPELVKSDSFAVVGNFPYNISSQILFRVLDYKDQIPVVIGMFQKEVAERVTEGPGKKSYGIISVLIQAFYDAEYLFTVDEDVFDPPPKVKSGVIRLVRNDVKELPCDEKRFKQVVKMAFNQRRKTLRNSLKQLIMETGVNAADDVFNLRPEQLSVNKFIELTQRLTVNTL